MGCNSNASRPMTGRLYREELPFFRRTPADRWTTAASRSPGWWLKSSRHLPGVRCELELVRCQWFFDVRRTTYSCGRSPGFNPEFPLYTLEEKLLRGAR